MVKRGYEIDSQGNVGNETRRIEDLQLRFILLMAMINTTIEDSEDCKRMSEQAVRTCHKDTLKKILKKYGGFLDEMQAMSSSRQTSSH